MKETKAERIGEVKVVDNPICMHCGNGSQIRVDWLAYTLWQAGGLIQQAFPNLNAAQREMMISGTHPYCWKEMMGEDDE